MMDAQNYIETRETIRRAKRHATIATVSATIATVCAFILAGILMLVVADTHAQQNYVVCESRSGEQSVFAGTSCPWGWVFIRYA